jgi:putative flippase GtrA
VLRFLIVGAWNTLFALGLYALLVYVLSQFMDPRYAAPMTANALGSVVCITVSFVCHKFFVFRTRGNFLKEYLRSFVVYGGAALIGFILLPILIAALNRLTIPERAVPYLAGVILTAGTVVVSFFGHKQYTFSHGTITESTEQGARSKEKENSRLQAGYPPGGSRL